MFPDLLRIGDFRLGSYGLLLMIGALLGIYLAAKRAPAHGLDSKKVADALFWCLFPGLLGARITYMALNWSDFAGRPDLIFSWQFQGLTSYGGMVAGFLGLLAWTKRHNYSILRVIDTFGVPVLVAHAFGRVGCLLNGCCHGHPSDAWYAVPQGLAGARFEPAQLMDTVGVLLAALAITLIERKGLLRKGQSFALVLVGYAASRFVYEFGRAGTAEEVASGAASSKLLAGPLTLAHLFSLLIVAVGVVFFLSLRGRSAQEPAPAEVP